MEDIIGILHKDGKRSHFISLDEYFTKEQKQYMKPIIGEWLIKVGIENDLCW